MAEFGNVSDSQKVQIVSNFIKNAPPGEFNEVFNDVRVLLNNDRLLKEGAASAFAEYNEEQFTPAKVDRDQVIVSAAGKIEGSKYLDPRNKKCFKYDHLRKEASEIQPISVDQGAEQYRSALDSALTKYIKEHFPNGVGTVYGSSQGDKITLIVCLEDHKFSPQNFWLQENSYLWPVEALACQNRNGRWRSEWTATFSPGGTIELKGNVKVQVHYYEDGNVQLVSFKDFKDSVTSNNEAGGIATEIMKVIEKSENTYQTALGENYKTMSQTTFKALRRQLPITRAKFDWNKHAGYKLAGELKGK